MQLTVLCVNVTVFTVYFISPNSTSSQSFMDIYLFCVYKHIDLSIRFSLLCVLYITEILGYSVSSTKKTESATSLFAHLGPLLLRLAFLQA